MDTKADIAQVFAQAPTYVQDFIRSGKYEEFLTELRTQENMHIDVLDIVSDEILMMLLGMSEPLMLADNLKEEAVLTDEQTAAVIALANQRIFMPLQESMRNPVQKPQVSIVREQAPSTPSAPLVRTPEVLAPASSVMIPEPVVAAPVPAPVFVPPPAPIIPPEPTVPVAPVEHTMRTMAHDIEAMQGGTLPAPVHYTAPTPRSQPVYQAPVAPSAPAPLPTPLPSAPEIAPVPEVVVPRTNTPSHKEVVNTLKQYGIDPYREAPE